MFTFNIRYFLLAFALLAIEVLIALFVRDGLIRPYGGDFLVVILIYCAARTIVKASSLKVVVCVLIFSYCIETLQYLHILDWLAGKFRPSAVGAKISVRIGMSPAQIGKA